MSCFNTCFTLYNLTRVCYASLHVAGVKNKNRCLFIHRPKDDIQIARANVNAVSRVTKETLSTGDEITRAVRASKVRPRQGEGGSRRRRSQSKLSRGYAFCANQVTVSRRYRGILYRTAAHCHRRKILSKLLDSRSAPIFPRRKFDTTTFSNFDDISKLQSLLNLR